MHDHSSIVLPPRIAKLAKTERGYPVPFFASVVDGKPDLRYADPRKQLRCARERVCWVCGGKLGKEIAFIGGPISAANGAYSDGPMHRDCAEFSLKVCPHLAIPMAKRHVPEAGTPLLASPGAVLDKPDEFVLYVTRAFRFLTVEKIFLAGPALEKINWRKGEVVQ